MPQLLLRLCKCHLQRTLVQFSQTGNWKHSLHKYSSWNRWNIHAYGLNWMLTLSDNNPTLHPASLCAPISRKLTLNLVLNCGCSHTIQHTHFFLQKRFLPSSPLPWVALLTAPPPPHEQTAVHDHQRDYGKSREAEAGEGGEQCLLGFLVTPVSSSWACFGAERYSFYSETD